jgi:hypothetical protein
VNEQLSLRRLGGDGILDEKDLAELSAGVKRVYQLMSGGSWHTAEEIELAAGEGGVPAREGLRRMRELRGAGFEIERERVGDGRVWRYRIRRTRRELPRFWRE